MIQPKNGLYIASQDFMQWQDYMAPLIESEQKCMGICNNCRKTYDETKNPDLRVKNITFVVTERCNLDCTYCYECNKTNIKMTKEIAKQAVDFIFDEEKINGYYDFKTSPAVILEFIGGEPLLEIDLMNYIVEYFKFKAFELDHPWATSYMISFTSNGVLYRNKEVQDFIKRNPGKVSIGITVDGNKELHDSCRVFPDGSGSYDIVEKSIKEWLKIDKKPQTKITLCPENVMHLNDALRNVWDLGIIGAFTNCVFEEGWTNKDAKILYSEMIKLADYLLKDKNYRKYYCSLFDETIGEKNIEDRNWCGGNGEMLAIAPDGRCFPCIRFMKYSLSIPGREEQPIGDIWNGLDKKEDNKWLNELKKITMFSQCQHEDNKKCLDCPISTGCSLCTGYNYDKFGDPNHKAVFICEMHQARILANAYYWNKLYKYLNVDKKFKLNIPKEWALKIISEDEFSKLLNITKGCDNNVM
ncbi:radical SAM peptide maturase, CXXX-repeat target family [Tissierella praeacuta]|uniref:radical SAM peptide maturase, CXXX-repeat target family n=1 Tax=Tissierella praeacuta TaxID=43131 RepID=UPI003518E640